MAHYTRIGALVCAFAATSMAVSPAQAAGLPDTVNDRASAMNFDFSRVSAFDNGSFETAAEESEYHRRYRRYRHRRNRIDGGDVLAGVLILGGIAAIASAASNNNRRERDERVRYENRRYDERRYDDRRSRPRNSDASGLDNAVSQCLAEIEQDVRVESVDGASRVASGWIVSGTLFNGSGFSCQIDNSGRISDIDYGGYSGVNYSDDFTDGVSQPAEGQWSAASYAEARASIGVQSPDSSDTSVAYSDAVVDEDLGPQPAYPGGPLPGEEGYPD